MAEIGNNEGRPASGAHRQRKKSTRIDMTAMVDVAFLLLTFFILTTTLAQPMVIKLISPPKDEGIDQEVAQTKIMTILLGADNKAHYYTYRDGDSEPILQTTDLSHAGIRVAIQAHLDRRPNRCPPNATVEDIRASGCWDPIIVLKPGPGSKMQNFVDILDEMQISQVPKYAFTKTEALDTTLMLQHQLMD